MYSLRSLAYSSITQKRSVENIELDNITHVLKQTELVWQDQVSFASELRDKRRMYTVVLALYGALGVFRMGMYKPIRSELAFDSVGLWIIVISLVLISTLSMFSGAYLLYTDRSLIRNWVVNKIESDKLRRRVRRFFILYTGLTPDQVRKRSKNITIKRGSNRASHSASFSVEVAREAMATTPDQVVYHRYLTLNEAYQKLAHANNRVNRRIEHSVFGIGLGYVLLGIAVIFYTVGILFVGPVGTVDRESTDGTDSSIRQEVYQEEHQLFEAVHPFCQDCKESRTIIEPKLENCKD